MYKMRFAETKKYEFFRLFYVLQRKKPKYKKLKVVTDSSEEKIQFRKYLIEKDPKFKVQIEMDDTNDPIVTLLEPNGNAKIIEAIEDDIILKNHHDISNQVLQGATGALMGLFNFITSIA